jgi:hypothetical protein
MAEPGPQCSGPLGVGVGEAAGDEVTDVVVGVPVGDAEFVAPVVVAGPAFGAAHDASVDVMRNSMRAEPKAVIRWWGCSISEAFRRRNLWLPAAVRGPPFSELTCRAALAKPRYTERDKTARTGRGSGLPGVIHQRRTRRYVPPPLLNPRPFASSAQALQE